MAPCPAIAFDVELVERSIEQAASRLNPQSRSGLELGDAEMALEPELRNQDSHGLDLRDYLTDPQLALWSYLGGLPAGNVTIEVPGRLRRPSTAAREVMDAENERLRVLAAYADAVKQVEASEKRTYEVHEELIEKTEDAAKREGELTREISELREELAGRHEEIA